MEFEVSHLHTGHLFIVRGVRWENLQSGLSIKIRKEEEWKIKEDCEMGGSYNDVCSQSSGKCSCAKVEICGFLFQ